MSNFRRFYILFVFIMIFPLLYGKDDHSWLYLIRDDQILRVTHLTYEQVFASNNVQKIYLAGYVNYSGVCFFEKKLSLIRLITLAGDVAYSSPYINVYRKNEVMRYDIKHLFEKYSKKTDKDLPEDLFLQDGDIVERLGYMAF